MGGVLKITLKDLPAELRRLPARDAAAVIGGIHQTLALDAHRWIQWSIRGGGTVDGVKTGLTPSDRPRRYSKKKKVTAKGKGSKPKKGESGRGLISNVLSKLGFGSNSEPKKTTKKVIKKIKKVERVNAAPGYRQPIDTGEYANSWKHVLTPEGGEFWPASTPPIKAAVIEAGRRPAPIPREHLAQWVRRKLNVQDPKKAARIAFLISRKASKTRRPGLKVLERAAPRIEASLLKNVHVALRRSKPGT